MVQANDIEQTNVKMHHSLRTIGKALRFCRRGGEVVQTNDMEQANVKMHLSLGSAVSIRLHGCCHALQYYVALQSFTLHLTPFFGL